jgi:hypothetical protein
MIRVPHSFSEGPSNPYEDIFLVHWQNRRPLGYSLPYWWPRRDHVMLLTCRTVCQPALLHWEKKKTKLFLFIYKEIQMGSVTKSYMRKGFLKYEEMRKYLTIYEEDVTISHIRLCNRSHLNFLILRKILFSFLLVWFDTYLADSLAWQALCTVSQELAGIWGTSVK